MGKPTLKDITEAIGAPDAATKWYSNISRWTDIYSCKPVIKSMMMSDGDHKRKIRSLSMAKRICEDWASLLWTENAAIEAGDPSSDELVQDMFGDGFTPRFTDFLEKDFAKGFGVVEVLVSELDYTSDGDIVETSDAMLAFDFVDAERCIPLEWRGGQITAIALVSYENDRVDVREHYSTRTEQTIINRSFHTTDSKLVEATPTELLERGIAPSLTIPSPYKMFCVLTPAISNNIDPYSPFGLSVFANAEDQLEGVDKYFDNFIEDVNLGGKMVFVPDTMLRKDMTVDASTGKVRIDPTTNKPYVIPPQKDKKNLFVVLEGETGVGGGADAVTEHNPDLRVDENKAGMDAALSLLSSAVGMGSERYVYRGETIATATQVISENSDLFRSRRKHMMSVTSMLISITRAILWCAQNLLGRPCDPGCEIVVSGDDSVIEDDNTRIDRGLKLFQSGAISQKTFLTKYMGMTDENADAEVSALSSSMFA